MPAESEVTGPLYHLAVDSEWRKARDAGEPYRRSTVATSLEDEGFIHCSFADQLQGTAEKYYRGRADVVLLEIEPSRLGCEVRVENGFPHLYGPLPAEAVVRADPVPLAGDGTLAIAPLLDED